MSFYRWCMRHGAAILFIVAILQFLFGMVGAYQVISASAARSSYEIGVSNRPADVLLILQTMVAALATPAVTFFGALVVNRLDRPKADLKQAEPFE